ncbi:MAG: hypothetical protein D6740_02065, partial [Alphaproteobacteria bacterium]
MGMKVMIAGRQHKTRPDRRESMGTASLLAALMLGVAAPVMMTATAHAGATALERRVEVKLAPQPLSSALLALSRQTGLAVVAARELTAHLQAPAIEGRMTPL